MITGHEQEQKCPLRLEDTLAAIVDRVETSVPGSRVWFEINPVTFPAITSPDDATVVITVRIDGHTAKMIVRAAVLMAKERPVEFVLDEERALDNRLKQARQ